MQLGAKREIKTKLQRGVEASSWAIVDMHADLGAPVPRCWEEEQKDRRSGILSSSMSKPLPSVPTWRYKRRPWNEGRRGPYLRWNEARRELGYACKREKNKEELAMHITKGMKDEQRRGSHAWREKGAAHLPITRKNTPWLSQNEEERELMQWIKQERSSPCIKKATLVQKGGEEKQYNEGGRKWAKPKWTRANAKRKPKFMFYKIYGREYVYYKSCQSEYIYIYMCSWACARREERKEGC